MLGARSVAIGTLIGCGVPRAAPHAAPSGTPSAHVALTHVGVANPPEPMPRGPVDVVFGGDVCLGRTLGQVLLREPERRIFKNVEPWLASADLRLVNLESQLSEQAGETVSPTNRLVFTGPPNGADALAGLVDGVSLANNHAWDYGRTAFFETLDNLARVEVAVVGAATSLDGATRGVIFERNGLRIAVLAFTDVWNFGPLAEHPAASFVSPATPELVVEAVARAREGADAVIVSYHGGAEYAAEPSAHTRALLRSVIDAGADMVIGHHPHVIQGIEWRDGRPIAYSLGNLLMGPNPAHPLTALGMMVRARLDQDAIVELQVCPHKIIGLEAVPLLDPPRTPLSEEVFAKILTARSASMGGIIIDPLEPDGCAVVRPGTPSH